MLFFKCLFVHKATVTVVDIDSGVEEKIVSSSQGSATGLNLKENQKLYFGGLPTVGNYRYEYKHTDSTHSSCTFRQSHVFIVKHAVIGLHFDIFHSKGDQNIKLIMQEAFQMLTNNQMFPM